jgi:hypothetical protein
MAAVNWLAKRLINHTNFLMQSASVSQATQGTDAALRAIKLKCLVRQAHTTRLQFQASINIGKGNIGKGNRKVAGCADIWRDL